MLKLIHITCLVITLSLPWAQTPSEPTEPIASQPVPFYINEDEVKGGVELVSSIATVDVPGSKTIDEYVIEDSLSLVILRDAEEAFVALDVVSGGLKETLNFNAFNSAKADIAHTLTMTGLPPELQVVAYQRMDTHPQLPDLVRAYREATKVPGTEEASDLSVAIALDLYRQLRDEGAW